MVSINVLIFTYKQQDLIVRAVDSILSQREFGLKNIVISDDCSPDGTWDVICKYKEKYPDIIVAHRNTSNLGIYGNWNQMISMKGEADIYYILAGDDALCDGILEQVQLKVEKENIDVSKSVAIYFDWKYSWADGSERVCRNNSWILKTCDVFGLKLRDRISCRSCFVTEGLMNCYKQVDTSHGIGLAETMADMQYSYLAKKNYYESYVGSIYYAGIGVSVGLMTREYYEESIKAWEKVFKIYDLKNRDFYWVKYRMVKDRYSLSPNIKDVFLIFIYYLKGEKFVTFGEKLHNLYKILRFLLKRILL